MCASGNAMCKDGVLESTSISNLLIQMKYSASANVKSINNSALSSEITSTIMAVNVDVGDEINTGDILVKMNCKFYDNELNRLKAGVNISVAEIELASSNYNSAKKLEIKSSISKESLLQKKIEYEISIANKEINDSLFKLAQLNVDRCVIRSPFNAIVVERIAQVGEHVMQGTKLIKIIEKDKLEIVSYMSSKNAMSIKQSQDFIFESNGNQYPLKLLLISNFLDPKAGTKVVRFSSAKKDFTIGAVGEIKWAGKEKYLPQEYLSESEGVLGIFVTKGGNETFIPLPAAKIGRPTLMNSYEHLDILL